MKAEEIFSKALQTLRDGGTILYARISFREIASDRGNSS